MDTAEEEEEEEGGRCDRHQVDNSSTVINKIANLYAERLMSDVVLVVGNCEYPSHRLILCASSGVFQARKAVDMATSRLSLLCPIQTPKARKELFPKVLLLS